MYKDLHYHYLYKIYNLEFFLDIVKYYYRNGDIFGGLKSMCRKAVY